MLVNKRSKKTVSNIIDIENISNNLKINITALPSKWKIEEPTNSCNMEAPVNKRSEKTVSNIIDNWKIFLIAQKLV